jgi:hypothetical protein
MSNNFNSKLARRWNWGAFLLGPVWALVHQVWIGLIAWLPQFLIILIFIARIQSFSIADSCVFYIEDPCTSNITYSIVYSLHYITYMIGTNSPIALMVYSIWYFISVFILGIKGNKWALKTKTINDLANFNFRQKVFSILGFLFGLPLVYVNIMCLDFLIKLSMAG